MIARIQSVLLRTTALLAVLPAALTWSRPLEAQVTAASDYSYDLLGNRKSLTDFITKSLKPYLETVHPEILPIECAVEPDTEHDAFKALITTKRDGARMETVLGSDSVGTAEFEEVRRLAQGFAGLGLPPFTVRNGEEEHVAGSFQALVDTVLAHGKKGQYIQRYKGLGEMNPDQLWKTTMDPELRTLLQVRIDDTVEADEIFTVLMGDQVEPRREFIEANALEVRNLDI